jgi:hypothetical protein
MSTPEQIEAAYRALSAAYEAEAEALETIAAIPDRRPGEQRYRQQLAKTARARAEMAIDTDLPMAIAHRVIEP